jgi:hypothetical protein
MRSSVWICAMAALISAPFAGRAAGTPGQHSLTVTLNYDFTVDNACTTAVTKNCLQQFNIYELTSGTPVKLFSVPAPPGANNAVTGITGTSGALSLKSGVYIFGATAQMADGSESSPNASTATATAAPGSPVSFSLTVQ